MPATSYRMPGPVTKQRVVEATTVSQEQVTQQIKAIKDQQQRKENLQKARLKKLQAQAFAAKKARLAEQNRVAKLKVAQRKRKLALVALKKQATLEAAKAVAAKKRTLAARQKAMLLKKKMAAAKQKMMAQKSQKLQQKILSQQLAQEQEMLKKIQAQEAQGVIDQFAAQIKNAIMPNWIVPAGTNPKLKVNFVLQLAPDGTVVSLKMVKSSGNRLLDQSARVAIIKSSPLPVPKNPAIFNNFRRISLSLSPEKIKEGFML